MSHRMPRGTRAWTALLLCALVSTACGFSTNLVPGSGKQGPTPTSGTEKAQPAHIDGAKKVIGAQYPPQQIAQGPVHVHPEMPPLAIGPVHPRKTTYQPATVQPPARPLALTRPGVGAGGAGPVMGAVFKPASDVAITQDTAFASALSDPKNGEETSEASSGNVVFFTGNWFAAYSIDGGATFTYLDPTTVFPSPAGEPFCCDQVVQYDAQHDLFFWLIQYDINSSGEDTDRLAIASPATLASTRATGWYYYDFTPETFSVPGLWLDFPDLTVGSNALYWTTNVFKQVTKPDGTPGDEFQGSVISRLPLAELSQGVGFGFNYVYRTDNGSLKVAQNTGTHAFWASHNNNSQMRVFDWVDGSNIYSWHDIDIASWNPTDYGTVVTNPIDIPGKEDWQKDWQANHKLYIDGDGRVRGGTLVGNEAWFAWTAGRDSTYTQPNIELVRISTDTLSLIEQRVIWNQQYAFAFPTLATNSANEVGMAFSWGGGGIYNGNDGVAILTNQVEYINAGKSTAGTPWWGDYITIRTQSPDSTKFTAGEFLIDSCGNCESGFKNDPTYIEFGRA